jgi:hypothetical protein
MSNNNNNEIKYFLNDWDKKEHDKVVINSKILVDGALNIYIIKTEEDGTETIKIEGVFTTEFYEKNIESLESSRYYVDNIDVTEEQFGSKDDTVIYKFNATRFHPKYQTEKYDTIDN